METRGFVFWDNCMKMSLFQFGYLTIKNAPGIRSWKDRWLGNATLQKHPLSKIILAPEKSMRDCESSCIIFSQPTGWSLTCSWESYTLSKNGIELYHSLCWISNGTYITQTGFYDVNAMKFTTGKKYQSWMWSCLM